MMCKDIISCKAKGLTSPSGLPLNGISVGISKFYIPYIIFFEKPTS